MAARKAFRIGRVLECTGWSRSTLYDKIAAQKFPPGHKPDPTGQTRIWWEDEVEAFQKGEWSADGKASAA